MRLYGKKFIKSSMDSSALARQESRDGILWDILSAQRLCRVKIQGSNQLIVASYPQHWATSPNWLKPGVSVRIAHVGGDRGRIEVFGQGRAIPTPVSGNTLPDVATGDDGLISGCYIRADSPTASMSVFVQTGSFRIDGTIYYISAVEEVVIDAAPAAGLWRYDLISVGSDSTIDYTAGSASATPVKPSVGSSHVGLGYILVSGGSTVITDVDIGHEWTSPGPHAFTIDIGDEDVYWADPDTVDVTVNLYDQYGNPFVDENYFSLEIYDGNGMLHSDDTGDDPSFVEQTVTDSSYTFTYTRNKIDTGDESETPDLSPTLKASVLSGELALFIYGFIRLYDSGGVLMR